MVSSPMTKAMAPPRKRKTPRADSESQSQEARARVLIIHLIPSRSFEVRGLRENRPARPLVHDAAWASL
jgi:hypothetical protein